jgi:hypothetical protein
MLATGLVILLVGWSLPWIAGRGLATTYGAFDLAEWISLVPGIRYGEQPMLIPGLLRAPLMLLAIALGLLPRLRFSRLWWLCLAGIVLLSTGLLPPLEFFIRSDWRGDVNYGQMAAFAGIALGGGLIGLVGLPKPVRLIAWVGLGIALLGCGVLGQQMATQALTQYALKQQASYGLWVYLTGLTLFWIGGALMKTKTGNKNRGR